MPGVQRGDGGPADVSEHQAPDAVAGGLSGDQQRRRVPSGVAGEVMVYAQPAAPANIRPPFSPRLAGPGTGIGLRGESLSTKRN